MIRPLCTSLAALSLGVFVGCSEPVQPEPAEQIVSEPRFTHTPTGSEQGGWKQALAHEEDARIEGDEQLHARIDNLSTMTVVEDVVVEGGTSQSPIASCPEGTILTGGGVDSFGGTGIGRILAFGPSSLPNSYSASISNEPGEGPITVSVTAICLVLS